MSQVQAALAAATQRLAQAGIGGAAGDARRLMALALGVAPGRVSLHLREGLSPEASAAFEGYVARRADRMPLSHITGQRAFFGHSFRVTPDVLDPRPETEALVLAALELPFTRVLDLGTGSGAILLSLLAARPQAQGLGTDISAPALAVAQANAHDMDLAGRARFVQADWCEGLEARFDLIVSNPPYIAAAEVAALAPEVLHEPHSALTDRGDGLGAYRAICAQAPAHLAPGGALAVEIGWTQGAPVQGLFQQAGFSQIRILPDLDGRDRVVFGQKTS